MAVTINMDLESQRRKLEREENWDKVRKYLGDQNHFFELRKDYSIMVDVSFGGATTRFLIKYKYSETIFSVYFDFYDRLGSVGQPYYELYPHQGDIWRAFEPNDILMKIYEECEDMNILLNDYPEYYLK